MDDKYYDLDVPLKHLTPQLFARVFDCGYQFVAVSQSVVIDDFNFETKTDDISVRKKTKEERQLMRSDICSLLKPPSFDYLNKVVTESHSFRSTVNSTAILLKPRIFRRITIYCENQTLAGLFFREFGEMLNAFDVVAFCPMSEEAFAYACDQATMLDLITIDLSGTSDLRISSKQCSTLLSRGLHLEFHLAPLLRFESGSALPRSVLSQYFANLLCSSRKSFLQTIIISSGASSGWEVRRPLAVISMLVCLGLKPREAAYFSLKRGPHAVITHGLLRSKSTYSAAAMIRLLSLPNVLSIRTSKEINPVCGEQSNGETTDLLPCKKIKSDDV